MKKTQLFLFSILLGHSSLFAQNAAYRVEQLTKIKRNNITPTKYDTTVQKFIYKDDQLQEIHSFEQGKEVDVLRFTYSRNDIKAFDKINYQRRYYQLDKEGRTLQFANDKCVTYSISSQDGKIAAIESNDKCDRYEQGNVFEYNGNLLSRVKTYNKKAGIKASTDYVFTYTNNQLSQVIWGNNIDAYKISGTDNRITAIECTRFGKPDWKRAFQYDVNENITEELVYAADGGLDEHYLIQYSFNKGNDYLLWDTNDWRLNKFLHQRTYKDYHDMHM